MTTDVAPTPMSATAAEALARSCRERSSASSWSMGRPPSGRSSVSSSVAIRRCRSPARPGRAEQALAMLGAETAPPDIVCISWLLEDGDAGRWAFVDEVRRRCPDARLMMTCPDERDDVSCSSPAGTASRCCTPRATRFTRCAGRCTTPPRASPTSRPAWRLRRSATRSMAPHLQDMLSHVADGDRLGLSEFTVGFHSRAIFARLGVESRIFAVASGPGPG